MDRNGFIYFNTRLSPKNSGKADSYAWAIMILDEVLPYQVVTDLKENGNQPAEFNVNLIAAFKVEVKVLQSYTNENGGKETHVGERNCLNETKGYISRTGSPRSGKWEVIIPYNCVIEIV